MPVVINGSTGLTFPDSSTQAKSATDGQTGDAPFYSARAWVNFNGTGTVAIRASGNVSSITDNNVGDYTVNFTTAMPDVNYVVAGTAARAAAANTPRILGPSGTDLFLTTSCGIAVIGDAGSYADPTSACVTIFR